VIFANGPQRSIDIQFHRFLTDLAGEPSLAEALSHVARATSDTAGLTPRDVLAVDALLQYIDGEAVRTATWVANTQPAFTKADRVPGDVLEIRRLAVEVNEEQRRSWAVRSGRTAQPTMDYLASYEDYFPSSESSAAATLRAKLLADAGYRLTPDQLAEAMARARNFDKLTVFNRVGGVLIGRRADTASHGLDGFSLRQEPATDGRSSLVLRDASGQETRFGPYLPDIIYRALLFAADGRPLVVTILNTGLGRVQKVMLHLALVDTAIAAR
jgi:hypothetical protein